MTFYHKKLLIILTLAFSLAIHPVPASAAADTSADYSAKRSKLLSYIIQKNLSSLHFSHKEMDDSLSKNAFELYLKQLDAQKRFLLTSDVERLRKYASDIDDEMLSGVLELPIVAAQIMKERAAQARTMANEILAGDFDITKPESLETDPEKLDFCKTAEELRERWRQILKYQLVTRYMNMLEDKGLTIAAPDSKVDSNIKREEEAKSHGEIWREAQEKIMQSYENFFSRMQKEDEQDHYDRYFNSVAHAYDPHTDYLPPTQKEDFDIHMRGSLEGIGALLREEDGYIKVAQVIPGSASFRQGQLQAEDIILEVGEGTQEPVDITDTRIRDAVALIRGKKGTEVRLFVKKPDGARLMIPIIRDVVQIEETFVKSMLLETTEPGQFYGYIKIPSFYRDFEGEKNGGPSRNVTDDVRLALHALSAQKTDGLIIDLRNNGGGALEDAVSVAGLFIKKGPIVQIKDSDGDIKILEDTNPGVDYKGQIVLLVSKFSASASEILAGALQDYRRAIVVGSEHTHGKGTVQTMIDLNYNLPILNMSRYKPLGALKVTTQKFYRVSGASTQYRGITPDIILPDRLQHLKSGEQYNDFSLPWDTVSPTSYQEWQGKQADLTALREKSKSRVAQNKAFQDILDLDREGEERSRKTAIVLSFDALRQQFAEDRQRKDKLIEDGLGHDDMENQEESPREMTAEQREKLWRQEVKEDPYIKEAASILLDVTTGAEQLSGPVTF